MNKIGFKVNEDSEMKEPVVGTAEVTDIEEENGWFGFLFPKALDFFMVYGALSLVRDVVDYVLNRG